MLQIRQFIAAGIFAYSLTVGAGLTADVAAKPRIPAGGDSHQQACRALQDKGWELVEEFSDPDTSTARKEEILYELRQIGRDWDAIGCRRRYGDVTFEVPEPGPIRDHGAEYDIPDLKVSDEDSGQGPSNDPSLEAPALETSRAP